MNAMGFIFVVFGLFSLCGGLFEWSWFMHRRKSGLISRIFGRTGLRIFYMAFGVACIVFGVLALAGVIQLGT